MPAERVALVTGAARGQGAAITARLLQDGFCVAACDLLTDEVAGTVADLHTEHNGGGRSRHDGVVPGLKRVVNS